MFVVFPKFCKHTHTHTQTDRQTDTQYDFHTLPPTLHSEGNNDQYQLPIWWLSVHYYIIDSVVLVKYNCK